MASLFSRLKGMLTAVVPDSGGGTGQQVNAHTTAHKTLPLPIEINQMIYKLVFQESYKVIWKGDNEDPPWAKSLNLLLVSSTMHQEALDPLYHKSTFIFDLQEYRAVPAPVYKAKVQAGRNVRLIVHHIENQWSEFKDLTARIDRFIKTFASSHHARRIHIDLNKFAIKRLAHLGSMSLLANLERIEIRALVADRTIYDGNRFHYVTEKVTTPDVSRRHMNLLARKLESMYGFVQATESGTEAMTHLSVMIRESAAFYLHATVRPLEAAGALG